MLPIKCLYTLDSFLVGCNSIESIGFELKFERYSIRFCPISPFEPVIKMADELSYDGLIVFTDGYAPFPQKPKARMLWAVCSQDAGVDFPYGKKVVIDERRN